MKSKSYRALISSDWNQCLAPCGPFDVITFTYPELAFEIETIFKKYTGNSITLGTAVAKIGSLLPEPISVEQMDTYLDNSFQTYTGVAELIKWCLSNEILFMINTTGPVGYFQRVFAKKLLPKIPVLAANPIIRYPFSEDDPYFYELRETREKGENTGLVLKKFDIPLENTIIIGDSGGDGPHFKWGERNSVYKIGSMTKQSLLDFCSLEKVAIDLFFGLVYGKGEQRDLAGEMAVDFLQLRSIFEKYLG
jgi:2-hydroxy-3-keto-5-methylthiopentenyl-1-phosphate phosphatase